jgi:hypothetical protein
MPSDQIGMTSTLENFAVLPSEVVTELWRGLTSGRYLALLRSRLAAFAARFAAFFTLRCLATMRRRSRSDIVGMICPPRQQILNCPIMAGKPLARRP